MADVCIFRKRGILENREMLSKIPEILSQRQVHFCCVRGGGWPQGKFYMTTIQINFFKKFDTTARYSFYIITGHCEVYFSLSLNAS
jgi:hypothetical protein